MALQLKDALEIIEKRLAELRDALRRKASEFEEATPMNVSQRVPTLSALEFNAWMFDSNTQTVLSRHVRLNNTASQASLPSTYN
jgi:hypothetical protein